MPPPDTIYIPGQTGPPPEADQALERWQQQQDVYAKQHASFVTAVDILLIVLLAIIFYYLLNKNRRSLLARKMSSTRFLKSVGQSLQEKRTHYHEWLCQYNAYYRSLPPDLQLIFLERVVTFMKTKIFRFHSIQEEEYMPVLISGAAVQMTFGLRNYLMDYFPVIHIIQKEYVLNLDKETYYGHVSRSGIYISWNHFMRGYEDYSDSINLGLHEMAHAVSFDVFLGQTDRHDHEFKKRLEDFAEEGRPVFRAMRQGASHILDDYGTSNFEEFWAVCIETFFENPEEFSRTLPELYISIVELLNQDPLKPHKIADKELAGFTI
jgi:MtfA peptidase